MKPKTLQPSMKQQPTPSGLFSNPKAQHMMAIGGTGKGKSLIASIYQASIESRNDEPIADLKIILGRFPELSLALHPETARALLQDEPELLRRDHLVTLDAEEMLSFITQEQRMENVISDQHHSLTIIKTYLESQRVPLPKVLYRWQPTAKSEIRWFTHPEFL